jgi:hypothetical protein
MSEDPTFRSSKSLFASDVGESTYYGTSLLARASSGLGVFALIILVLNMISAQTVPVEVVGAGMVVIVALAAFVLGILGLVFIRQSGGRVSGKSRAVTGLVTSSLAMLALVVMYGVVKPALVRKTLKLESSNNLKRLGLAMMYYNDFLNRLPPAVLHDQRLGNGGQPYSWRVAILPFLGEDKLFSQYRRDEPWDSPANKALLARMPRVFALPGSVEAAHGLTHYQVLVGPGTAFERPDMRVHLGDLPRIADTILVVEAAVPVPWTKPEDLTYAPNGPLPKVGGLVGDGGFHVMFADASVRWIEAERQDSLLRTLAPLKGR